MDTPRSGTCKTLVIGIGNEFRDDDALGVLAVRELQRRLKGDVCTAEMSGEGTALMDAWKGMDRVFIIDAVAGPVPGRIHRIDASVREIPRLLFQCSTHAFGPLEAIRMARALGTLPSVVILYGIEGEAFDPGIGLSDAVVRSIPTLLTAVEHELAHQEAVSGPDGP